MCTLFYSTLYPVCSSNIWNLTNFIVIILRTIILTCVLFQWVNEAVFCLNPWEKIDLSVCSTAKHWCSVTPLICSPEHTVYIIHKEKGCKIIKKSFKKEKCLHSRYQRRLLVTINYQFQARNWKLKLLSDLKWDGSWLSSHFRAVCACSDSI